MSLSVGWPHAVGRLRVGDGADPATDVGPLVTAAQQKRVLDYLDIGVAEGARILAQAPLPDDPRLANGFYVPPTLLTDVTPDMRVATEEIFGPVVALSGSPTRTRRCGSPTTPNTASSQGFSPRTATASCG